jgi:hypothetical protein
MSGVRTARPPHRLMCILVKTEYLRDRLHGGQTRRDWAVNV